MQVRILNQDKVLRNLKRKVRKMEVGSRRGMELALAFYTGAVKKVTPVGDTGNLINSYSPRIENEGGELVGRLRNSAEYAIYVHEMPQDTNFRKPGATNKFMERPLLENQNRIRELLAKGAEPK